MENFMQLKAYEKDQNIKIICKKIKCIEKKNLVEIQVDKLNEFEISIDKIEEKINVINIKNELFFSINQSLPLNLNQDVIID